MLREIKYMFFYDNICSLEKNLHEYIQMLQKFKLPWNKTRGGEERMPMDLPFCTTSVKK